MKARALVVAAAIVGVWFMASPAFATANVITWGGNGSDNLPCSYGGHWVLAPSFGIDSATLHVDGTAYVMTENGNGSWSADSVGAIDENVDAYVTFTGEGDERDHLQLSHCTEGSPSPSGSPSPTESPSPSGSPSDSPSASPDTTVSASSGTSTPSVSIIPPTFGTAPHCGATCPTPTAYTGSSSVALLGSIAGALVIIGTSVLAAVRRRTSG